MIPPYGGYAFLILIALLWLGDQPLKGGHEHRIHEFRHVCELGHALPPSDAQVQHHRRGPPFPGRGPRS